MAAVLILSFAGYLRLVDLESNPPGLWQDEASTGLDAYLIWTTGKERTGTPWPVIAPSFGDYPLAGYRYLAAPVVGLFGLSPGKERLIAAVFGTWFVLVTGWLVAQRTDRWTGLGAMITATLCPTWIHFSRYGSEAILLPATLATGWALIDAGRRPGRHVLIWFGAAFLAASAYTYHAVKLILPLWMIGFLWLQWPLIRSLWANKKRHHVIGPALLFALLVAPSVHAAFTTQGMARGKTVLAWYHYHGIEVARVILSHYLSYFDPGMLFIRGGPAAAQSIPGLGMWSFLELPLLLTAFAAIFRPGPRRRFYVFVVYLFVIGPLPGGVTYESQNMGRAIAWLPAPQILSGIGMGIWMVWGAQKLRSTAWFDRTRGALLWGLLVISVALTGWATVYTTLIRYPTLTERDFQFEISAALRCAKRHRKKERIVVSPAFQMAPIFAQFHFAELDRAEHRRVWILGERKQVGDNELYAFPANRPAPSSGQPICKIEHAPTRRVLAYVYAAAPPTTPVFQPRALPRLPIKPRKIQKTPPVVP